MVIKEKNWLLKKYVYLRTEKIDHSSLTHHRIIFESFFNLNDYKVNLNDYKVGLFHTNIDYINTI